MLTKAIASVVHMFYFLWRVIRVTLVVVFCYFLVALIFAGWLEWENMFFWIFAAFIPWGISLGLDQRWNERRQFKKSKPEVRRLVREHYDALQRSLDRAQHFNQYGALVRDDTVEAVLEFMESTGINLLDSTLDETGNFILDEVEAIRQARLSDGFDPNTFPVDGIDFEYWVAEAFRKFGWVAEPTVSTGDQGIDVIIVKAGKRIGIQTKRYSGSVGNKSVQEAYAGKQFHGLDAAAVLSNADFTPSAKSLAASNSVFLMSQYDIPRADALFGICDT